MRWPPRAECAGVSFASTTPGTFALYPSFEVMRDAQRFLFTRSTGGQGGAQGPTVVQNWLSEFAEAKGSGSR